MTRMPRRQPLVSRVWIAALAALCLAAPHAGAQIDRLDRTRFIEGLADRRMSELLGHYIDDVGDQLDPIESAQLRIQQSLMAYRDNITADDPGRREAGVEAFTRAVEARQTLISDHGDDPRAPMWMVDLAEMLLIQKMKVVGNDADLFMEFGVPTPEQRALYSDSVVDALVAARQGFEGLDRITGQMGRQPEVREQMELSGLLRRFEEYRDVRAPYFLAQAAYKTTLLPDEHPYFADIAAGRSNPQLPTQARSVDAERTRLLGDAYDLVEPFARDTTDPYGIRPQSMALAGRVQAAQGELDAAISDWLNPVIEDSAHSQQTFQLAAWLGKVLALVTMSEYGEAQDQIMRLRGNPLVRGSQLYQLLVADAEHLLLLDEAEQAPAESRDALVANAYQPYLDLLEALDPGQRAAMRVFLFQRWADTLAWEDAADYPPMVRMGMAEIAAVRANAALGEGRTEDAADLFDRAIAIGQTLTDPELPDPIRAQGMFNYGAAIYQREALKEGGQDLGQMLRMIDLMTVVAQELPSEPVAEQAMAAAVQFSRQLYDMSPRPAGAEQAFLRATEVLFNQYDNTQIADQQRLYYAQAVLQPRGDYEGAAAMYARVPRTAEDYFLAQQLRMDALQRHVEAMAPGAEQVAMWQQVIDDARSLHAEALEAAESTRNPTLKQDAQHAAATALAAVAGAQIALDRADEALQTLEGFEERFADDPYSGSVAVEKRILAYVATGQLEAAGAEARRMMEVYPDTAASVVSQVLDTLERQMEQRLSEAEAARLDTERQRLRGEAEQLAATAVKLAEVLLQWAQTQDLTNRQMLPYKLPLARSLRLSGKPGQAVELTEPLLEMFPDSAQVIAETAEAYYATGEPERLRTARRLYIKLIRGLEQDRGPLYWRSWVRVLSIADQLGEGTEQIAPRVRQLQRQVDPNLGGPRFKRALEDLRDKHQN